jgi:CHAT domain-containing protein
VALPLHGVVIEGSASPGQALTDGGDRLFGDGNPVSRPASLDEVSAAAAAGTVVYLSCHGQFRWDRPLSTGLQLGADPQHLFELPVADIFDVVDLPADALMLLGACDSGTIAQTDLNEGIGLPAAFLAAGARAVVGANWPVARGVAVGVCLRFLQALRSGQASPEALRAAIRWIRDATIAELDEELAAIHHPLYRGEPTTEAQAALRRRRAFAEPSDWASYVHWGGAWTVAPAPSQATAGSARR